MGPEPEEPSTDPGPWTVVKAVASIITPVTLITALMYYFGLLHAYWFFSGFGVDYTVFELSAEDYILRSADGLIFPFCVAAMIVLLLSWLFQLVVPKLSDGAAHRAVQIAAPVFSGLGVAFTTVAAIGFLRPSWFTDYPALSGLTLVLGVLLLTGAIRAFRWLAPRRSAVERRPTSWVAAEWTAVILLVSVGLFWAAGDWSARVGSQRAADVVSALPTWPSVVVYAERSLNLGDDVAVSETVCSAADGAFAYRYDGLTLITQEGGQLLLVPRAWTSGGTAIVLTKTDAVRLEFSPSPTVPPSGC